MKRTRPLSNIKNLWNYITANNCLGQTRYALLFVVLLLVMTSAWSGGRDKGTSGWLQAVLSAALGPSHPLVSHGAQKLSQEDMISYGSASATGR